MSMRGHITWRGISLGTGTRFGITSVEGWEDLPDVADSSSPRPFQHGEAPGRLLSPGRTVTVEGYVYDRDATDGLVAEIEAATYLDDELDVLTVEQFGRTATAEARILRRSLPQARGYGSGWQPWALQFRAPDPLRYLPGDGDVAVGLPASAATGLSLPTSLPAALGAQTSTGRLTLSNLGPAAYRPVLAVRGPLPYGFEVTHLETGRRLRYVEAVPADEVVTLDSRRRRVRLSGGSDRRGALTVAQWFEVPGTRRGVAGGASFAWASLGADYDAAAELRVIDAPAGALW